jgi:hypothetical protein
VQRFAERQIRPGVLFAAVAHIKGKDDGRVSAEPLLTLIAKAWREFFTKDVSGVGMLVEASGNVIVGDSQAAGFKNAAQSHAPFVCNCKS